MFWFILILAVANFALGYILAICLGVLSPPLEKLHWPSNGLKRTESNQEGSSRITEVVSMPEPVLDCEAAPEPGRSPEAIEQQSVEPAATPTAQTDSPTTADSAGAEAA